MFTLTTAQLSSLDKFVHEYIQAENAATGSRYDSNANVTSKNVITLLGEMVKPMFLQYNRFIRHQQMVKDFGIELADDYIDDIKNCRIYQHDETHTLVPYCLSISLFPFLQNGSKSIGGITEKPKHLSSFCGGLINLMNQIAATIAGACLYKDQILKIKINDNVEIIKIKDFISKFDLDNTFVNYQGKWEYADISKFNASVYENGKFVKINKIMRRAYKQDIYEIVSKTGLRVKVSQDHIFKQIYRNRTFETKANMLQVGDTLVVSKDYKDIVNKTSRDYLMGQLIGIIAGDGSLTQDRSIRISVNKHQTFIMDRLDDLFEMFFNKKGIRSLDSRGEGVYSYIICGTDIVNQLKSQFIKCEKYDTYNKNITLENRSLDWQLGFLDGLIVTDGCFSKSHGITLTLTNEGLIKTTKQILSNIDINLPQISSYTPTIKNRSTLFKIHIPAKITKYLDLVQQKPEISCDRNRIFRDERVFREVYYCGKNAAPRVTSNISIKRNTESHSIYENTDVITAINRFENDDDYVYEIETESHWYNCGGFITHNCAVPSLLVCFDFFARKDYGENYLETNIKEITQEFQHLVYYLNEPCSGRNGQCVRADTTQLWTPNGFKYLHELKVGDECYVWKNGKYEIEKIKKLNIYDYNDELLQFSGRNYQQTVTPNHRIVYRKANTDDIEIAEAYSMFGHSKLSMPICADIEREDYPISDDLLILATYALTDGNIHVSNDHAHRNAMPALIYYVSKNRKSYQAIINSLNALQITYSVKNSIGKYGEVAAISLTPTHSKEILSVINQTKKQVPDLFLKVSSRQANIIIKHWSMSDGQELRTKTSPRLLLQCDNHEIADKVQQICLLAGMGSSVIERQFCTINGDIGQKKTIYVNTFSRKFKRISEYSKVFYHGKVWCPTTDAGVVIFREENKTPYISGNSIFWNVSIFDQTYLEGLYGDFVYPNDFSKVNLQSVMNLQEYFLKWFNKERERSLLTFPVITCAMVYDKNKKIIDQKFKKMICEEMAAGNGFFVYLSDSVESLSSCCRLRNESKNEFSFTLGNVGEMTGSVNVITINMNRFIQDTHRLSKQMNVDFSELLISELRKKVQKIHKYHVSIRKIYEFMRDSGMYPVHDANFIKMERQFSTIGINGLVEGAEYLGYDITPNEQYMNFCATILKTISTENKAAKQQYGFMFNTEFVPGENAGHKLAQWDKRDGYVVPRECYNSYFYRVEDDGLSVIEKAKMHGKLVTEHLDGGSAVHYNMDSYMTAEQYSKWIDVNAYVGVNYFCTNILITCCEEESCGHINKNTEYHCVKCGSKNISHATRIIGFLKKIKNFSKARQEEAALRYYHKDRP